MTTFAAALKLRMAAQGFNQTALAAAAKLSKSAVSQLANGVTNPSDDTLQQLADALHCTAGELTGEEVPEADLEHDVPVAVAAKLIGKPEEFVRKALIQGTAPFGFAVKGESRYSFSISPKLLRDYTGKEVIAL